MKYVTGMLPDYVICVPRGVTCFAVSQQLRLVAGGGREGRARLWTMAQREHHATLAGHGVPSPIVDIAILENMKLIVACCANCTVFIWDLYEECLLQTIKLKFPFLGVLGKKVEFGAACLFLGPPAQRARYDGHDEQSGRTSTDVDEVPCELYNQSDWPQDSTICELLVTWSDCVCTLQLCESSGEVTSQKTKREHAVTSLNSLPTFSNVNSDTVLEEVERASTEHSASGEVPSDRQTYYTEMSEDVQKVIDDLGLTNIFGKNFVTMCNIKHDINKKLYEMELKSDDHKCVAGVSAPYLSLQSYELDPLPDFQHLLHRYNSITKFFPGPSVNITPASSQTTTPRNKS
ncbi:uncharacterized protein LOC126969816 [Leptidea sinapis]|uniref:uncharacterized protein LOC126969816 n=1 Tax=Leptidea sinapis TaxID=189913 RepID=UPI0021C44C64|nr:uncharacterized protein LOC126969816 [Leptidea sinapis]